MAVKWKWKPAAGGAVSPDLTNRLQAVETKASSNETNITNLQNDYLSKTTTTSQSVASQITFTQTGEVVKINPNSDTASYLSGYKSGNQRVWYFGKSSSTDNHLRIGADRGNIKIEPNGDVDLSNKKIIALADPTADQGAANKRYVDNRIKKRVLTITNTAGQTYIIQPTNGYEIISVMVGRKRTAEGYYFFNYQSTLNFQLFMDNSGAYKLYTEGAVSGFNGDYKIIVVEMKV